MATITKITSATGALSFRAQVRVKRDGQVIYQETKTFSKEKLAKDWAARVEAELKVTGAIDRRRISKLTLADLIERYLLEVGETQRFGRTKRLTLEQLARQPIAQLLVGELKASHVVEHCKLRHKQGAGAATTTQDVIYLGSVLGVAAPLWNLPVTKKAVDEAYPMLHKLKLIGRSDVRDRRCTTAEYQKLLAHEPQRFQHGRTPPMGELIAFAIASCMRQEEITRILWADVDMEKRTVIIRQRKDPAKKELNDQEVPLLGDAWTILQRQPKTAAQVFPYNARSVSAAFTRMCKELQIENLRFHDLRHEGISRLFEAGYQIQEVAIVSGHKNWGSLRRYTNLRPEDLHGKHELVIEQPAPVALEVNAGGRSDRR